MKFPSATRRRIRVIQLFMAAIFVVFMGRLFGIQELSYSAYASDSVTQVESPTVLPAQRGGIYDRNGEVLAQPVSLAIVEDDPKQIKDPAREAALVAPILHMPTGVVERDMTLNKTYVRLGLRVPNSAAARISALVSQGKLPGVYLQTGGIDNNQIVMPNGTLGLPLLGTVSTSGQGQGGLEEQFQTLLAGRNGLSVAEKNGNVQIPGTPVTYRAAVNGTGIETTIDSSLQSETEAALAAGLPRFHATSGEAEIMDCRTGDILAAASLTVTSGSQTPKTSVTPSSPGYLANGLSPLSSGSINQPATNPLPAGVAETASNWLVTQDYEPGSVFKLVPFSAALGAHVVTPQTMMSVPSSLQLGTARFADAESHGTEVMTASQILAQSSNLGTIEVAQRLGQTAPQAVLSVEQQAAKLGFGRDTDLRFPGETPGQLLGSFNDSSIGSLPIGQVDSVPAQQVLDAYNTVCNGGVFVEPRIVRGFVSGSDNRKITAAPAARHHRVFAPWLNQELTQMLANVVSTGTGAEAGINGYTVAGKTGTAQIPGGSGYVPGAYYGTFVGFAPAQHPVFSAIVVYNHPTPIYGGATAAPVFSQIMANALREYNIPTTTTVAPSVTSTSAQGTVAVPSAVVESN